VDQLELIAATAFGLEAVVVRELRELGFEPQIIGLGRVLFHGDEAAIVRANLWLRTADRVVVRMGNFPATDFGQLFDGVRELPWERWLPADASFPVTGRSLKSQLSSVPACQKIVKKAVVERLRAAHHTQTLDETGPRFPIHVALHEDEATLTIDTCGASLHKRGYRTLVGPAPLKETLAAALVLLSYFRPSRPMMDPFCGAGTIAIEAAMIGRRMAPGLTREFLAESWPGLPERIWQEAREEARDLVEPPLQPRILGTDVSREAIRMACHHAEKAGVAEDIHFQQKEFDQISSRRQYGCVISNPPYGIRVGDQEEVHQLYESIPLVLRRLPTWSHFLLSANSQLEEMVGRKADRRRKLYNGRIQCTFYQFHGPKPPGARTDAAREPAEAEAAADEQRERVLPVNDERTAITTEATDPPKAPVAPKPAFGGLTPKAREQADLFARRLSKRARHLRRWPTRRKITCYRLYDRDIPEIPLAVDRYEDHLHIAEYTRPHERTPAEHADWIDLMVRTAGRVLEVPPQKTFVKRRQRQRGRSQYERGESRGPTLTAHEAELQFHVNLSDYIDTGLFLDHRITRSMVRQLAKGARFVDLFGYTGAFTVYAAAGGAASTITVDWSNTYLRWARDNMKLNGFDGPQHRFVPSDALSYLNSFPRRPCFDLAVVDPPTYSNSKRTESDWDIQRDHVELINELLLRISPGGTVFFSTNSRRFKFGEAGIREATIREISRQTVPEDYRNRRIHRCWRLVRSAAE
jgi:23S rRNA (guanine2445-N2)-methyltransferase / 23S rRNA (guanine2069-N7)-methyltransferase